ncbi:MAG: asparagine synthase-related protein [Acidimicrobiales bacterium]
MCGIAGTWTSYQPGVVAGMLDRLAHRGPDAAGMYAIDGHGTLGHRRLSIVDLHGGDQPLIHHDAVLVGNGEVYNAPQLRAELASTRLFGTGSDNEVILNLIADRGEDTVDRLTGMFAFALAVEEKLVLGRDPLGIKPLYVGTFDDQLIFASELRAFPAGTTGVEALAPGSVWSSDQGSRRYWTVPDPQPIPGSLDLHARRIRDALETSVVRRMMADVPVGAFLSGGLDSSAIVALLRRHVDELHTFSVGLPGSPDIAAARLVADHLGTVHHEYLLDRDEIVDHLPAIVGALESFDQDLVRSAVPTYFTARLAARHVKVVMTGEGADELFAGYTYHKDIATPAELHADARRALGELHHVNLQRVDRLTMAHSLEARVPFLDTDLIATALSIPPELRMPATGGLEKAVLRRAVEDLLPAEVVWRDKALFDEGSGTADLLPELSSGAGIDLDVYRAKYPGTVLRSAEECWYHQILVDAVPEPDVVLPNVARWTDR